MKRVLLAVAKMIFPPFSGGEARILTMIKRLSGRYRFSLIMFEAQDRDRQHAAAMFLENAFVHKVHLVARSATPAPRSWLLPDHAYWLSDPNFAAQMRRIVIDECIDLVHFESSALGQYARGLPGTCAVVMTEHDASIICRDSYHRSEHGAWSWRGNWDWLRRAAHHREIMRGCDRVVVLSQADQRLLSRLAPAGKFALVPTGVDLEHFEFHGDDGRRPAELVFVGHYPHYPNEDAAVFAGREILPRMLKREPRTKLTLVGSDPTPPVLALRSESVAVTGTVPDVRPYLREASVFLAPVRLGHGIKGKVLEAFAAGLPVAATRRAVEAMPGLRDGEHLVVADRADDLAGGAIRLVDDPALRVRMAKAARAYVEERFGWDKQADLLDAVYREALARRASA